MQKNFMTGQPAESIKERYAVLKELGDCHAAVGDAAAARQCYQDACNLAPEETGTYVGMGLLAAQDGRLEEARRSFDIARHLDPACAGAYEGLATIHRRTQNFPAAFEMYLKCLELDTNNLMALLGLFQTSCQMGTFSKITYYLEIFLETNPQDTSVLFCLATLYARDGRLRHASKALRRVLDLAPDKIEAAKLLAQVTSSLAKDELRKVAV